MKTIILSICLTGLVACKGSIGDPGDRSSGDAATAGDATGGDPAGGDEMEPGDATLTFEWSVVPALVFTVGLPVNVDLHGYLTDPSGTATIALDVALPPGLTLTNGSVVGTPTAESASVSYVATADDGNEQVSSLPFTIEVNIATIDLRFERSTPEQIGIYIPLSPSPPGATTATVRYRLAGAGSWQEAHPLLRIRPEWNTGGAPVTLVDAFAGTIFDLVPGTAYDVDLTITPPTGAPQTLQTVVSTRSLPAAAGAATVTATTSDNLQAKFDSLTAGDVLELAAGTYDVSGLQLQSSGTAQDQIVIRGVNRDTVILRSSGRVLQILQAAHVVIEDLTMEGTGVDSGTSASSVAVSFWDGAQPEYITFRRLTIRGVDKGIIGWGAINSILVYQCTLRGNNLWDASFIESNLTWNDDGIRVPGEGNCAFDNTLHGFGDTLAVNNGVFSAAVYFYRNKITMTGDDAVEGDYGTRNVAFYDNHVSNVSTLLSLDPLWGGPLYCFRNIAINTVRGPFKLNNQNSGFMIYNNTIVRTDGTTGWGWVQFNNGELRNFSFRNNLLIYHGGTSLMALESGGIDPVDFSHNGWHPDGSVWWSNSGGSASSLAGILAALPATTPVFGTATQRHEGDLIVPVEPFDLPIPLGADHLTEVTGTYVPTLETASPARGGGVPIPNVTDGHSGAAPDMGAIISGRPTPNWGAP